MNACHRLTKRERDVMALVAKGKRNRQIAELLMITEGTVEVHLHNIFQKLDVSTRTEAALVYTLTLGQANVALLTEPSHDRGMEHIPSQVRDPRTRHERAA